MSDILKLVDRLVATSNRMAVAEHDLADLEEQFHQLEDALAVAKERIASLETEVETKQASIRWWADRANKFEEELKKHDTGGD